jgi:hypothetical protein
MRAMRRNVALAVVLLGTAALVALVLGHRRSPTDVERIRALFDDAARAAEGKRIGDVVRDLSEQFEGEGLDRRGAKQLVAVHVLRGSWVSVIVTGASIDVQGDAASAVVDVALSQGGKGRTLAELLPEQATLHRFACRLAREREGWKVTAATWRAISLDDAAAGPPSPAPP